MTKKELNEWKMYYDQYKNGYHLSDWDWTNFIRLNHQLMDIVRDIHNQNMLGTLKGGQHEENTMQEV